MPAQLQHLFLQEASPDLPVWVCADCGFLEKLPASNFPTSSIGQGSPRMGGWFLGPHPEAAPRSGEELLRHRLDGRSTPCRSWDGGSPAEFLRTGWMLRSQGQVAKISTNTEELRADPKEDPTEDPISGTGGWEAATSADQALLLPLSLGWP